MRPRKSYSGPFPDPEISLFFRSLYGVYELLEQIYMHYPPLTLYGKEQRWDGIVEYYRVLSLISRKKPGQVNVPFICRKVGNA